MNVVFRRGVSWIAGHHPPATGRWHHRLGLQFGIAAKVRAKGMRRFTKGHPEASSFRPLNRAVSQLWQHLLGGSDGEGRPSELTHGRSKFAKSISWGICAIEQRYLARSVVGPSQSAMKNAVFTGFGRIRRNHCDVLNGSKSWLESPRGGLRRFLRHESSSIA